ncbi:molybdate ABC transporter substrate-binding protein [Tengunoibacter tsumagoiensis]|uniref:Molybdenum ABC transporter substrate-binding protein n=1 Tax=Tengunoibacter tsumagoiensis TaxID=2014871 RepID=A0A401ZUV8_9CHLR|nr:molybdate ABC transporter substrate-binding protein [Tengunoibacter tsumagoiensis]GCE10504.1 molybdenum ABC transporter substrate-binding protein [Tengunoibacter tsumagoiensis]
MHFQFRTGCLYLLLICSFLAACGSAPATSNPSTPQPVKLTIFAASSLTESFKELQQQYTASHHEVTFTNQFAGSQVLAQQLTNGARADILASADQATMKKVSDAGLSEQPQVFAKNKLVVIVPASNPAHIQKLKDLARPGLKIVVAAPSVPVGKYGLQVLDNLGKAPDYGSAYESAVKANFVSQEDNVKSVVNKVQLNEADAGFVYLTDVTPDLTSKVKLIDLPDQLNVIAEYPIAVLKSATSTSQARNFVDYLLSTQGQAILKKYHFIPVH